jgi:hypothetical protein
MIEPTPARHREDGRSGAAKSKVLNVLFEHEY